MKTNHLKINALTEIRLNQIKKREKEGFLSFVEKYIKLQRRPS